MDQSNKDAMQTKLKELGIPAEKIQVFGAIKCNIHVTCRSLETAQKWGLVLAEVAGTKVALAKTRWPEGDKRDVSATPTMINGYLVAVAF